MPARRLIVPALLVLLMAGCAGAGAGMGTRAPERMAPPAPDYSALVGTWTGVAYAEGDDEGTDVSMTLGTVEGKLMGTVTAIEQMLDAEPLQGLTYQDDILTCWLTMQGMRVDVRLTQEGDVFNGSFYAQDLQGVMTLRKVKE